ncbi:MAG: copper homeostasis protein CutC [Bacteroidota bacterium]
MLVEVCANSLQSAVNAQRGGADRIELCSELAVGGITPSYGLLQSVREHISIPVHVLIRPRSGDFTYSDREFEIIKRDVALCTDLGFEGIVSGVMHQNFTLDIARTRELVQSSKGLHFTFHRAFDWVKDPFQALEKLEVMGVDTVLSSGLQKSAWEGIDLLARLNKCSSSCTIMPGGGIGPKNVKEFKDIGFEAVHLSGTRIIPTLDSLPRIPMSAVSLPTDGEIVVTDVETIRKVVKRAK